MSFGNKGFGANPNLIYSSVLDSKHDEHESVDIIKYPGIIEKHKRRRTAKINLAVCIQSFHFASPLFWISWFPPAFWRVGGYTRRRVRAHTHTHTHVHIGQLENDLHSRWHSVERVRLSLDHSSLRIVLFFSFHLEAKFTKQKNWPHSCFFPILVLKHCGTIECIPFNSH